MPGFNNFAQIAAKLHTALHDIVGETATEIATDYSDNAPKRTGWMASTAYASTTDGSTYGQTGAPPTDEAYLLPEVTPPDDMTAIAGVAASYAGFPELGTRYQAAQPTFYPAVETARGSLQAKLDTVESRL